MIGSVSLLIKQTSCMRRFARDTYIFPAENVVAVGASHVSDGMQARRHLSVVCLAQRHIDDLIEQACSSRLPVEVLLGYVKKGSRSQGPRLVTTSHTNNRCQNMMMKPYPTDEIVNGGKVGLALLAPKNTRGGQVLSMDHAHLACLVASLFFE